MKRLLKWTGGAFANALTDVPTFRKGLPFTGLHRNDATSEVERYFVLPGQALAYKVGMQKILDMRADAQEKLGAKVDLREVHRVVLTYGARAIGILETRMISGTDE